MLTSLMAYARQRGLVTEPGFAAKAVRWGLCFTPYGGFDRIVELGEAGRPRNPGAILRCPDLTQPELKRAGAGWRHFLVDTLEVVALFSDREVDDKLRMKHHYFIALLTDAARTFDHFAPLAKALNNPLTLRAVREALALLDARPQDRATPGLAGPVPRFPVREADWHPWWRARRLLLTHPTSAAVASPSPSLLPTSIGASSSLVSAGDSAGGGLGGRARMRCLASGALVMPVSAHPKVAGLSDVGGLSMGDSLAPFKQQAFCSYGLVHGPNAAVSEDAAVTYRAALDDLIARAPKLAGVKAIHWFDRDVPKALDPLHRLGAGSTDPAFDAATHHWAAGVLTALLAGRHAQVRHARFFAAAVSGASGRVMVRSWRQGTIESLLSHVQAWFADLDLIEPEGSHRLRSPAFSTLLAAVAPPGRTEVAAPLAAALWDAAIDGRPIPRRVQSLAWDNARGLSAAPQLAAYGIALLKAALNREALRDTPVTPGLHEHHPSVAYQCGRLTAALLALRTASGAGDRAADQRTAFAAGLTPARVLGVWLRRERRRAAGAADTRAWAWLADRLDAIASRLPADLPASFTLDEQSAFALGFYHQRADNAAERARRRTIREESRAPRSSVPAPARTSHVIGARG